MVAKENSIIEKYPDAHFGVLVFKDFEPKNTGGFAALRDSEVEAIRGGYADYDRSSFLQTEPVCHYVRFYKRFKKTYHVLNQFETVVLKGAAIPDAHPFIRALFLTEIKDMLLIACHDLDGMERPLFIGAAEGGERYTGAAGQEIELKPGDIFMRDAKGVIVSIIYGQCLRTRVKEDTRNAMFLIDGVPGLSKEAINAGLQDILKYVRAFDPLMQPFYMDIL
jgi:DNA/RNA-binding domain of Phe-tRNA-synthetase-like protein